MEPEQWEEYRPYARSALLGGTYTLATGDIFRYIHTASSFTSALDALTQGDRIYKLFLDSLPDELLFLWQLSQ